MLVRTALLLALGMTSACADAQAPETASPPPVAIADGRAGEPDPTEGDWLSWPSVQQAIGAAEEHWARQDPMLEPDLRVLASASGAFTEAGATQDAVLYLVSLWPRCCPKVGIAVLEGDRLVRNVTFESPTHSLSATPDLDGDGLNEVVLTSTFGMGGSWSTTVTALSLGPDGPRDHGSTTIYSGECGTGRPDATEAATRLLAAPGPAFSVERFTKACDAEGWTPEGEVTPLDLDPPPAEAAYVDLTAG